MCVWGGGVPNSCYSGSIPIINYVHVYVYLTHEPIPMKQSDIYIKWDKT